MKNAIVVTSDLHVGHTAIDDFVGMVREIEQVLALLVLGDAGESLAGTHYPIMIEQLQREVDAYTLWYVSPRFGKSLLRWKETRPEARVDVISGHLHEHVDVVVENYLRARVIGSGYRRPGYIVIEV